MRDSDKNNSNNHQDDLDLFGNIELDRIDETEIDEFIDAEHSKHQDASIHKKTALSVLSKRTFLVSLVVLAGFSVIFMSSWIFEMLGLSSSRSEVNNKNKNQISEVITLPMEKLKETGAAEVALAPSPIHSHARAPEVIEKSPATVESKMPKNEAEAMGVVSGSSAQDNAANSPKENANPNAAPTAEKSLHQEQSLESPQAQHSISEEKKKHLDVVELSTLPVTPVIEENFVVASEMLPKESSLQKNKTSITEKKPGQSFSKQETLLLHRKPEHYTIQVIGMQDEEKLKQFISQNPLKEKLSFYKTLREGKAWYVVVYGDFQNKQQAEAALLNLPKDIQKNKPWARSIREIQGAIRAQS